MDKLKIVNVCVLFSKNNKIGSKFISRLTKHLNNKKSITPSHVALLIENRWVFESTFEKGIKITPFSTWSSCGNEIVHLHYLGEYKYHTIKTLYRSLGGRKYDWLGVIYLGIKIALNKLFGCPIGNKNLLENPNKYFCTEVLEYFINKDLSMTSPVELMVYLLEADNENKNA
ncbi:MAG: hypothetical protein ABIM30_01190 [candidate division WOR-3 bacterium]